MKTRGLGRVYPRGGRWYVDYSVRGQRYREATGFTNRADAVKLLKKRLGEIGKGGFVGPKVERTTFEDLAAMLADDYRLNGRKSLDRALLAVKHLRSFFGRSRAVDITHDRILAYVRSRMEDEDRPAKPATVRTELAALGRMFTLGLRAGKVATRPPLPTITIRNTREGFFEEPEFRAVIAELPEDARPLAEFLYLTGWRKGEALSLTWRQVDFTAEVVRLEPGTTKNDEGRMFPFRKLPALGALLNAQRARTSATERDLGKVVPWVFHRQGRPIRSFREAWQRACARAGVHGRYVHDFRRTAVRNLERARVPRSWAMKLTGHKTESVYRRYAIVSEADLGDAVGLLGESLAAQGARARRVVPLAAGFTRTGTVRAQMATSEPDDDSEESPQVFEGFGAGGGGRTRTRVEPHRILSPARLPVPPLRHLKWAARLAAAFQLRQHEGQGAWPRVPTSWARHRRRAARCRCRIGFGRRHDERVRVRPRLGAPMRARSRWLCTPRPHAPRAYALQGPVRNIT